MKYFFLVLAVAFSTTIFSQTSTDHQVSLSGIGAIRIDMSKAAVEKLINKKITLTAPKKEDYVIDTVKITYSNIELEVAFYNKYISEDKYEIAVYSVSGSSSLLKTKSSVGVGDDKIKIITTYDTYHLDVSPLYNTDEKGNYKPDKTRSTITLFGDTQPNVIIFNLESNKLISFTVSMYEGC